MFFVSVMINIFGPSFANNSNPNVQFRAQKLYGNKWTFIAFLIKVGKIFYGEALVRRIVLHWAKIIYVFRTLTLTIHPNIVAIVLFIYDFFQIFWHVFGKLRRIVERNVLQAVNLVQFQINAGFSLVVSVEGRITWAQERRVESHIIVIGQIGIFVIRC